MPEAERPPIVVLENVAGMLTSHSGNDLETLVQKVNELGYTVDLLALDAADFVPQSRVRLFVIGVKSPYKIAPPDWLVVDRVRPRSVVEFMLRRPELVWGSLSPPVPPKRTQGFAEITGNVLLQKQTSGGTRNHRRNSSNK